MTISISDLQALVTRSDLNEVLAELKHAKKEIAETNQLLSDLLKLARNGFKKKPLAESEFFSPSEFGSLVGRRYSTIVEWCVKGILPGAIQPKGQGTAWFIPKSALEEFKKQSEAAK